jgi:hypothetical protein
MANITLFWTCLDGSKHQINNFETQQKAKNYALSVSNLSSYKIVDYDEIKKESDKAEIEFFKSHPELNP